MWKRRLGLLLLLGSVLAAGGMGARYFLAGTEEENHYRLAEVERGPLTATISATGTIEPEEVIDVGAQVAAYIKYFGPDPDDPRPACFSSSVTAALAAPLGQGPWLTATALVPDRPDDPARARTIDYGSRVHKGTLLAQLDDSLFQARLEQAQAAVEVAQAQVDQAEANIRKAEADLVQMRAKLHQAQRDWVRAQALLPRRAIAELDYDTAEANYETAVANVRVAEAALVQARAAKAQAERTLAQARATLHEAEVNLGYTQIRSPVEGVIVDRRVNVGQTVVAGLNAPSLFLIAKDPKRLQVWASVNEADISSIHPGQAVRFTVDAYPREVFTGQVTQIRLNASMTQNVVTYTVVVTTDNSEGKLLPYMTANLQFLVAQRNDVLQVPNAALRWQPRPEQIHPEVRAQVLQIRQQRRRSQVDSRDRGLLWVPDGRYVRPLPVHLGLSDGSMTEIEADGLEAGTPVVVGEQRGPSHGQEMENPFAPRMFGGKKGP